MRGISPKRLSAAIGLRDAAVALLRNQGAALIDGRAWFQRHTPENPEPRLAVCLAERTEGRQSLSVWATLRNGHVKVLTIDWFGEAVDVVTFRRGDWENELLAMSGSVEVT